MIPGLLKPFVDRLHRDPRPPAGRLSGHSLAPGTPDSPYIAVDGEGHLHLLLRPAAAEPAKLRRFARAALAINNAAWVVSGGPIDQWLDIALKAPPGSPLMRPFLGFCEDILVDLEKGSTAEKAVHRTCLRWQRFWEEDIGDLFSLTWLLGLLGELSLLSRLLAAGGGGAVRAWTGPEGADHDFQAAADVAIEVKTSTRVPAVIECGLNQLDPGLFDVLVVAVFHAAADPAGLTLPAFVGRIESLLAADEDALDGFLSRLARAGYKRQLEADYAAHPYMLADPVFHLVDQHFPRVTHASFAAPLDARILDLRYSLELSGLVPLSDADSRLAGWLRRLVAP